MRAAKYLQGVVGAKDDGKIGPDTLKAVKARPSVQIINDLCDNRLSFLKKLKMWPTFKIGWTRRVPDDRAEAIDMAARPTPEKPSVIEVEVPVTINKPVVPQKVEEKVKEKSNWLTWLTGILGGGGIGLGWLSGMDWQAIVAGGVVLIVFLLILLLLRSQIIAAVRDIKHAVET